MDHILSAERVFKVEEDTNLADQNWGKLRVQHLKIPREIVSLHKIIHFPEWPPYTRHSQGLIQSNSSPINYTWVTEERPVLQEENEPEQYKGVFTGVLLFSHLHNKSKQNGFLLMPSQFSQLQHTVLMEDEECL